MKNNSREMANVLTMSLVAMFLMILSLVDITTTGGTTVNELLSYLFE